MPMNLRFLYSAAEKMQKQQSKMNKFDSQVVYLHVVVYKSEINSF